MKTPNTPFSTRLSGSAKETELRLRSIFQWKKKRPPVVLFVLTALVVLLCFGLVSCDTETPPQENPPAVETPSEQSSGPVEQPQPPEPVTTPEVESTPSEKPKPEPEDEESAFSFADIQNHEFYFSSGAGAWATILRIGADGSFSGEYHDSDMGIGSEEYPNGTQYYCGFQGQFGQPVEVNAYTFSLPIESMNYVHEVGTEEIRDGIRFIYSDPNGLINTDHMLIYLPGAPLEELPMEYLSWVGYFDLTATTDTQLPFYGLYNEAEQAGFSGYERIASPEQPVEQPVYSADTQAVLDYLDNLLANGRMAMWCYLLPGTGPISASLDGYYGQVREVFARYNWTKAEEAPSSMPYTAETWELWLADNYICKVDAWSNSNYVVFGYNAVDGSEKAVGYFYDGEPGSLNAALANLWSGPEFRYALVLLPVNGQDDQVLMEAYETKFREMYLNSGAIDDYKLHELELIFAGEVVGGSQSPFFLMNYSIKPSDTSEPCWKNYTVGEDGWVDISVEVDLSLTGYENSETVWRCGFWQLPSKRD